MVTDTECGPILNWNNDTRDAVTSVNLNISMVRY